MTICFFGNYISNYPRIQVLKKAFKENGVRVVECHTRKIWIWKYIDLFIQHWKLNPPFFPPFVRGGQGGYDLMLVGMGGYTLVWFAKLLSRKPVVFDAFVSLYLTNVEDRKTCRPESPKARYYSWLDKSSCRIADLVLLDTGAQIEYFVERYQLPREKFVRVFESTDESVFYPNSGYELRVTSYERFIVHWHGHIVPFHGLEIVIEGAKLLAGYSEIEFRIVTRFNSKYENIRHLAEREHISNVKFFPETTYEGLAMAMSEAEVCLGVFGDNLKARVVIPNKVFEAVACGKAVITGRQAVLGEVFTDGKDILLCNPEDPEDLAAKVLRLYRDEKLKIQLSENARKLFLERLTGEQIGKQLLETLGHL